MPGFRCIQCGREYEELPASCFCGNSNPAWWSNIPDISPETQERNKQPQWFNGTSSQWTDAPKQQWNEPPKQQWNEPPKQQWNEPPQQQWNEPPKQQWNGTPQQQWNGTPQRQWNGNAQPPHTGAVETPERKAQAKPKRKAEAEPPAQRHQPQPAERTSPAVRPSADRVPQQFAANAGAQQDAPVHRQPEAFAPGQVNGENASAPKEEKKKKDKKKGKKGKVAAILIAAVLALGSIGAAVFFFVFNGSVRHVFGQSWFKPENGNMTQPLQVLTALENTLFDSKSFRFTLELNGDKSDGVVVFGSDAMRSTFLLHYDGYTYDYDGNTGEETRQSVDGYFYWHEGRFYDAYGKKYIDGLDVSQILEDRDYDKLIREINDLIAEDKGSSEDFRKYVADQMLTQENFKSAAKLVSGRRLNQSSVETLLNVYLLNMLPHFTTWFCEFFDGAYWGHVEYPDGEKYHYEGDDPAMLANGYTYDPEAYDAAREAYREAYQKAIDDFCADYPALKERIPDVGVLLRLITNFLSTDQAMVSFDISADGDAKNGSGKMKVNIPELVCDFLDYVKEQDAFKDYCRAMGVDMKTVNELLDTDALFNDLKEEWPQPLVIDYTVEKGRLTALKAAYDGTVYIKLTVSDVDAVEFDPSEYAFIEEMPGSKKVDSDYYNNSVYEWFDDIRKQRKEWEEEQASREAQQQQQDNGYGYAE